MLVKELLLIGELALDQDEINTYTKGLVTHRIAPLSSDQLAQYLRNNERIGAIVCPLSQQIDREVFVAGKALELVSNIAVGLNNIDLIAAQELGIKIAHTPGVLTDATADFAWALLLAGARRLVEGDRLARSGT